MALVVLLILSRYLCLFYSSSPGGFALVFQVRDLTGSGHVFAAKRVMVNNEADLKLAKQEIAIMVNIMFCICTYTLCQKMILFN